MQRKTTLADRAGYALLLSLALHVAAGSLVGRSASASAPARLAQEARALNATLAGASNATRADAAAPLSAPPAGEEVESLSPDRLLTLPAPRYFLASELDRRPHPLTAIDLPEPVAASEGYLILKVLIGENGRVDATVVVVNDAGAEFAAAAREAFGRARYAPGIRNGRAVKSQMMIEVKLSPAAG